MAKRKAPQTQEDKATITQLQTMDFRKLTDIMVNETSSILSDYVRQYIGTVSNLPTDGGGVIINPDLVLNTQDYLGYAWYDLYDQVEKDPHIFSSMYNAKINVAGLDWDVEPFGGDEASGRNKAIAEFVKSNFTGMEDFTQDIYELLDAIGKGFSVSEVIWDVDSEVRIKKFMNRPQRRIQFDAVTRQPKIRTLNSPYYGQPVSDYKFIVHRCSSTWENPFGDAIDQTLYWMWLFKKMVIKFWATQLEVGTAPIPFVKIPNGASTEMKAEALLIAKQIRSGTYGYIPQNFELLFAEAKNMAAANLSFEGFIDMCNDEMTKAINGQTLTTEASGKGEKGSRSLGEVHRQTQNARDLFRAKGLAATLNSTVVKWLIDWNYTSVEGYPKFKFNIEEPLDRKVEAETVKILGEAGYKAKRDYIENKFGIPLEEEEPIEEEKTIEPQITEAA